MSLEAVGISITVGLILGAFARIPLRAGAYGPGLDILLGMGGSLVGAWIFQRLGVAPEAGWLTAVVVASVGAAYVIVNQRKIWPALA